MQMLVMTCDLGFEVLSKKSVVFTSLTAHLTMSRFNTQGTASFSREGFVSSILREQPHSAGRVLYRADAYRDM